MHESESACFLVWALPAVTKLLAPGTELPGMELWLSVSRDFLHYPKCGNVVPQLLKQLRGCTPLPCKLSSRIRHSRLDVVVTKLEFWAVEDDTCSSTGVEVFPILEEEFFHGLTPQIRVTSTHFLKLGSRSFTTLSYLCVKASPLKRCPCRATRYLYLPPGNDKSC